MQGIEQTKAKLTLCFSWTSCITTDILKYFPLTTNPLFCPWSQYCTPKEGKVKREREEGEDAK
jgi:hypothetical protein